jgi:hypothetical protein
MLNVKSYDFKKISLHHLNQNITLCHSLISIVVVRRTPHKTGVCALPASAVGEQTWGKKKFRSYTIPVADAIQFVISRWQTAHH